MELGSSTPVSNSFKLLAAPTPPIGQQFVGVPTTWFRGGCGKAQQLHYKHIGFLVEPEVNGFGALLGWLNLEELAALKGTHWVRKSLTSCMS